MGQLLVLFRKNTSHFDDVYPELVEGLSVGVTIYYHRDKHIHCERSRTIKPQQTEALLIQDLRDETGSNITSFESRVYCIFKKLTFDSL
jgi:hypothetical protein